MLPFLALGALALGAGVIALLSSEDTDVDALPSGAPGRWFTWDELTRTGSGLANVPPPAAQAALRDLVANVLDPLREALGRPVDVTSAFRSDAVNEAAGGAENSQHERGEAADAKVKGMDGASLATFIVRIGLPFDQLIVYGNRVHISFTRRYPLRRMMLRKTESGYTPWSPPEGSRQV